MFLLVTTEGHFSRTAAGTICTSGPANYAFWERYLEVFDRITVLARVSYSDQPNGGEQSRSDGPRVSFRPLADYSGPWEFFRLRSKIRAIVRDAVREADAYILRVPGLVGQLASSEINRAGRPYALEVLGDPWDALGPGTWPSGLRPLVRPVATLQLKRLCKKASAVSYVTQHALQLRYPPGENTYATGCSDAMMDSAFGSVEDVEKRIRRIDELHTGGLREPVRIGFLGTLARLYKAPDILLRAAARCAMRGLNFELSMAGSGRHAEELEKLAERLKIQDRTRFLGQIPFGKPVRDFLDSLDLFVMPSRQEGLPRALLEAMARGCPCIGTDVGGIPELLAREDLVASGNANRLAEAIIRVARNPALLKAMARRNYERAKQFRPEPLREAHRSFLQVVRARAEK